MNKGIRFKVLVVLLSFIALYGFTTILNVLYNNEKDKVYEFNNTVKAVQTLLLKDVITTNDFFIFDANNNLFFNTGYSSYIEEHRVYMSSIYNKINSLLNSSSINKFNLQKQIKDVSEKIRMYETDFDFIISKLKIERNIDSLADNYLSKEITELKQNLDNRKNSILDEIFEISESTVTRKNHLSVKLRYTFELSAFCVLIIGIAFSIFLSKQTTKRIITLSDIISNFVQSKFTDNSNLIIKKSDDEIGQLIDNFLVLRKEVWYQINFLEENIRKRTKEISLQKDKILEQNDEILAQRDEVIEKSKLIQKQNTKILDSIRYAKTIQEAFLPDKRTIMKVFPECFIVWKPKDLVSGDFYWFKHIKEQNMSIFAVADCTGHGVPGGFMSMLGNALLNEIILRKKNYDAATILNILRDRLIETLQAENKLVISNDGMDIALVIFDHRNDSIQFAGANRPLYLIRNNEINKIPGDKMPIGNYIKANRPFINKKIQIENNDSIYLFSDGYVDQFGQENKRKFRTNQLKQLLLEHSNKPMDIQGEIFDTAFENWKGATEQTDDVLLIGLKPRLCFPKENTVTNDNLLVSSFSLQ